MLTSYLKNLSGFQKTTYSLILLFFVFNLTMLIRSFLIDSNDIREMVKMARYISYIKYVVIVNMILFTSIITIYYYEITGLKKDIRKAKKENKGLKSDLYEIDQERSNIIQG